MRLAGKSAIVTGAGSRAAGIGNGRAAAILFAREGARVLLVDQSRSAAEETLRVIREEGGEGAVFEADVTRSDDCRAMVADAVSRWGRLDILQNNVGIGGRATVVDVDPADWDHMMRVNVTSMMLAAKHAIPAMVKGGGGAIVNISSISALWQGRTTPGGFAGYDVAKAGVIRMATGLSRELAPLGIRINCLAPGWIDSDGPRQYWESLTPEQRAARGVPSRLLKTTEVADIVARIADDETLNGRVVVWWSEDRPRLVAWGDRGYRDFMNF